MGSLVDGVKTFNSLLRTGLLAVVAAIVGGAAYVGYQEYTARERMLRDKDEEIALAQRQLVSVQEELHGKLSEIAALNQSLDELQLQLERLETSLHLLKTDQRLAQLRVLEIERDDQGMAVTSTLEFVELTPGGQQLAAPRRMELPGDVIYIDNWVVKFDDRYVEQADIERGTSLCLFRRIFSEQQSPSEGISLDEVGMRPQAYARGGALSEFERGLWSEFWEFANNPERAKALGIRAANGEAVSIKVREGMSYHISLRASGGLSIEPVPGQEAGP